MKNKTIEDLRDEIYEKSFSINHEHVIRIEDAIYLLEQMRNITLDWTLSNVEIEIKRDYSLDPGKEFEEWSQIKEDSILIGKTCDQLNLKK